MKCVLRLLVVAAFAFGDVILSPVPTFAQNVVGGSVVDLTTIMQPIYGAIGIPASGIGIPPNRDWNSA